MVAGLYNADAGIRRVGSCEVGVFSGYRRRLLADDGQLGNHSTCLITPLTVDVGVALLKLGIHFSGYEVCQDLRRSVPSCRPDAVYAGSAAIVGLITCYDKRDSEHPMLIVPGWRALAKTRLLGAVLGVKRRFHVHRARHSRDVRLPGSVRGD